MPPTAHCSLQTPHWHWGIPVMPGDLEGRLGLTTMLTPSSTCHQSGSRHRTMIGAGSPTPHRHRSCHHQHQISHYTHQWSVMCDPDPVPTLPRLAEAGSACIQCMLAHAQMSDDWLPAPSPASPHHVQDYHNHNISLDVRDDPFNHLPFSSSLSLHMVIDNFMYILVKLLKQNGLKTGSIWNVF